MNRSVDWRWPAAARGHTFTQRGEYRLAAARIATLIGRGRLPGPESTVALLSSIMARISV